MISLLFDYNHIFNIHLRNNYTTVVSSIIIIILYNCCSMSAVLVEMVRA